MQPDALAPLIPVAAIIMFGLVRISRHWRPGALPQSPAVTQLEERLNTVEREIASLQGEAAEPRSGSTSPNGCSPKPGSPNALSRSCATEIALSVFSALTIFSASAAAQQPPPDFDNYVKRVMQTFTVPGLSVAIVKDGKVVLNVLRGDFTTSGDARCYCTRGRSQPRAEEAISTMNETPNHALQRTRPSRSLLQSRRPAGRVAELGSLGELNRYAWTSD